MVSIPEDRIWDWDDRLETFRVDQAEDPHIFEVEWVDHLPEPDGKYVEAAGTFCVYEHMDSRIRYVGYEMNSWKKGMIRIESKGKNHKIQVKNEPAWKKMPVNKMLESFSVEHLIARNDGFVFHCSYIDHDGKAILFTAPSQTGKSTQAELWKQYRGAGIINGDRAAVRLVDGDLMAEGIPFAGSSQYCENRSLPIETIVYLGQAPQTSIRKMRGYEAFFKIWEGVSVNTWDKEDMERVSAVVQQVVTRIPVYHMPCTPDESAVIALEEMLRKQGNNEQE